MKTLVTKSYGTHSPALSVLFDQYGYDGVTADVMLEKIEAGSTQEVAASSGADSVTVQTIHAAKGYEYPIVVLANINDGAFPPNGGNGSVISYEEPVGLRQRKEYADVDGLPHGHDNWRSYILRKCLPREYDEERRLLYVAITQAESHVLFTSEAEPNTFLEEFPVEVAERAADPEESSRGAIEQTQFAVTIPTPEGPVGHTPLTLMNEAVFEEVEDGKGPDFGTRVHDFAEAYALGEPVEPSNDDEHHVKAFLDTLDGELRVEVDAYLPLSVDGEDITVSGIIDLVHVRSDRVEIVDYKTDRGQHAQEEYEKQLSVYTHVVQAQYPDRDVSANIFYTESGERVQAEPLSAPELESVVQDVE